MFWYNISCIILIFSKGHSEHMAKKKIAVFSTGWASDILASFMRGMWDAMSSDNTDIYLFMNYANPSEINGSRYGEMNIMKLPDMKDFDGAVVVSNLLDHPVERQDIFDRCAKAGIPVVSHGLIVDGVNSVVTENSIGMKELVQHLIDKHGVHKIKFIAGSRDNSDSNERLRAVQEVCDKNGLYFTDNSVVYTNWDLTNCENAVFASIDNGDLPDAFICANDELAMSAIIGMERRNKKVPEDAIITGFDCIPEAQIFYPSVASVNQDLRSHGIKCAELVKNMMNGIEVPLITKLPCSFLSGESCGCTCQKEAAEKRLRSGTTAFKNTQLANAARWHMLYIERLIMQCESYTDIKRVITNMLTGSHNFEGRDFHILFDPECYRNELNTEVSQGTTPYSEKMDVIFSMKDNHIQNIRSIKTETLVPGISEEDPPHLYIFLPFHERGTRIGYVVFVDCFEKIESKALREFMERFNSAMEKSRKAMYLKAINDAVRELSHIDALTHVKNRTAYEQRLDEYRKKAESKKKFDFGIVLFDLNNLKKVNDELGHYSGDEYIKNSCKLICSTYKNSPVFRIGGDEFVVILDGRAYEQKEELLEQFKKEMYEAINSDRPLEEKVSIAYGMDCYEGVKDSIDDVVKRADVKMYDTKKKMKAEKR